MLVKIDPSIKLPNDVNLTILSFLDHKSLVDCAKVSRAWNQLTKTPFLGNEVWPRFLRDASILEPSDESVLEGIEVAPFLSRQTVKSEKEIFDRFLQFLIRVPLNQRVNFKCVFPLNPEYSITVELGSQNQHEAEPLETEICFFMRRLFENRNLSLSRFSKTTFCSHDGHFYQASIVLPSEGDVRDGRSTGPSNRLADRIEKSLNKRIRFVDPADRRRQKRMTAIASASALIALAAIALKWYLD